MCTVGLNPNIAPQHFHHEVVENHAAIGMGANIVEGFTVTDAIGKADGE